MTIRNTQYRAFTLVELMVSVALALLLLIGINQVFKTTTATVGTGYATSQVMRAHMAVEKVIARDFEKAVPATDMPCLIIHSQQEYGFRDRADLDSDKDNNATTTDLDGSGTEKLILPADYKARNHRLDSISFFAKDVDTPYRRQTGDEVPNTAPLIADEQSSEAWIWYGFVRMPNNSANPNPLPATTGEYFLPGQDTRATNPNNFFSSEWTLGRVATLLKSQPAGDCYLNGGTLAPLAFYATNKSNGAGTWSPPNSRFDIAQTTISDYRDQLAILAPYRPGVPCPAGPPANLTSPASAWYQDLDYHFNCKPWVTRSNNFSELSREMALATPLLVRGCNQFIVEYAGDYVSQNPDGTIDATAKNAGFSPDGQLDFIQIGGVNGVRKTRWYGMPRNVDLTDDAKVLKPCLFGTGPITGNVTGTAGSSVMIDVVPLRDFIIAAGGTTATVASVAPFEHFYVPNSSGNSYSDIGPGSKSNYLNAASPTNAMPNGATYVAAWGPDDFANGRGPKLIRLVVQLTDSNGRLNEGQVVEHVYSMPQY